MKLQRILRLTGGLAARRPSAVRGLTSTPSTGESGQPTVVAQRRGGQTRSGDASARAEDDDSRDMAPRQPRETVATPVPLGAAGDVPEGCTASRDGGARIRRRRRACREEPRRRPDRLRGKRAGHAAGTRGAGPSRVPWTLGCLRKSSRAPPGRRASGGICRSGFAVRSRMAPWSSWTLSASRWACEAPEVSSVGTARRTDYRDSSARIPPLSDRDGRYPPNRASGSPGRPRTAPGRIEESAVAHLCYDEPCSGRAARRPWREMRSSRWYPGD